MAAEELPVTGHTITARAQTNAVLCGWLDYEAGAWLAGNRQPASLRLTMAAQLREAARRIRLLDEGKGGKRTGGNP